MYKTASSCVQRGRFYDLLMTHFRTRMKLDLCTHQMQSPPPTGLVCASHGTSLGWEGTTACCGILRNFLTSLSPSFSIWKMGTKIPSSRTTVSLLESRDKRPIQTQKALHPCLPFLLVIWIPVFCLLLGSKNLRRGKKDFFFQALYPSN